MTARKRIVKGFRVYARFAENVFAGGMPFCGVPDDNIADCAFDVGGNFLDQTGYAQTVLSDNFSGIGFHFARNDFEECTFPFAIAAHEANAFSFVNVERYGVKKRRVAKTESQIFDGK